MNSNIPFSSLRKIHSRGRAAVYATGIGLAGRGLFWPLLAFVAAIAITVVVLLHGLLFTLLMSCSPWLFLTGFLVSGLAALITGSESWALVWLWNLVYLIASAPTLIWAGNPEFGGGVPELTAWVVLFGTVLFVCTRALGVDRDASLDLNVAAAMILAGYVLGLMVFVGVHVTGTPPRVGDWWMAPAFSALTVILSLTYLKLRPPKHGGDCLQCRDWQHR